MFKIDRELLKLKGFGQVKAYGDELLEKNDLEDYEIFIRKATEEERESLIELGRDPTGFGLEYFDEENNRFTISHGALVPEIDPLSAARHFTERMLRYVTEGESSPTIDTEIEK